ncbi:MAG: hypothetical protein AAFQ51_15260 [Pseudomonadota bacterium]
MPVEGSERHQSVLTRMLGGPGGSAHNLSVTATLIPARGGRATVRIGGQTVGKMRDLAAELQRLGPGPFTCPARINGRYGEHLTVSLHLARPVRIQDSA